ncbi:MAG TPA: hypothetical protein PLP61_01600 [Nocardioides sp.]|uniref:hypothetical protein n=1 Tax=Nocardioides sp. TaxID=35761 RepID=UPI002C753BCE|nr:hypothetical protein [Nocardioides sp.]HQR25707.1 hypothetical protein [Nocardioides sp.]
MQTTLSVPSYADLVGLVGQPVQVLDDVGLELTVECLSTPVTFAGLTSYSVRLTGPSGRHLAPGRHPLRSSTAHFELVLEHIGSDLRYQHYEAFRQEYSERR